MRIPFVKLRATRWPRHEKQSINSKLINGLIYKKKIRATASGSENTEYVPQLDHGEI